MGDDWQDMTKRHAVWLPRQDQLQKILNWTNLTTLLAELLDFSGSPESYGNHPDPKINTLVYRWDSMEQLWLAFVMKEIHNKFWNGREWEFTNAVMRHDHIEASVRIFSDMENEDKV